MYQNVDRIDKKESVLRYNDIFTHPMAKKIYLYPYSSYILP